MKLLFYLKREHPLFPQPPAAEAYARLRWPRKSGCTAA